MILRPRATNLSLMKENYHKPLLTWRKCLAHGHKWTWTRDHSIENSGSYPLCHDSSLLHVDACKRCLLSTCIGGGSGGDVSPLNFRCFFFVFACHPGGRCCVPRVPLPNNVNDVRKLSGKKMGGSPPPPAHQLFWELRDFILSQAWRARKNHARPPLNLCASAANEYM